MTIKCFDVVSMVVEEASSQFAPIFKLDNESYKVLEQYCGALDSLATEFGGKSFEVDIDDIAMTIAITLECEDMTIESPTHKFFALAHRAKSIRFHANEGNLAISFVFPSVWTT